MKIVKESINEGVDTIPSDKERAEFIKSYPKTDPKAKVKVAKVGRKYIECYTMSGGEWS